MPKKDKPPEPRRSTEEKIAASFEADSLPLPPGEAEFIASRFAPTPIGTDAVRIEIPVAQPTILGYRSRHVDCQLDNRQTRGINAIFFGMDSAGVRLANGQRVASIQDAVRWIGEQVADKIESGNPDWKWPA